jgi:hypothetical protein
MVFWLMDALERERIVHRLPGGCESIRLKRCRVRLEVLLATLGDFSIFGSD